MFVFDRNYRRHFDSIQDIQTAREDSQEGGLWSCCRKQPGRGQECVQTEGFNDSVSFARIIFKNSNIHHIF